MKNQEKPEIVIRGGTIAEVLSLSVAIPEFEQPYGDEAYAERLKSNPHLILVAEYGGKLVGFKVGYATDEKTFYSWMGGVLPAFRRNGIAGILAEVQTDWAKKSGYQKLVFKTRNIHSDMIRFGLKRGFMITELIKRDKPEDHRIIMEKKI
ncbi:GNAT family N-acetyltransferase [Echinicola vietnamensis]|uniref:Acetyltransferase n=1 Tax=Echinicola vietnamensis (strain DSM 17526 / LMG 23754 / KMM 6221) TaxID=926556 RepID=L0G042_ECHVK|nr:GNAT family N-acetyltransferase [Echinicola vietnamensis]AGA78658.1 acetyltransferase [Echinicola vietnamensis DSM 17526]